MMEKLSKSKEDCLEVLYELSSDNTGARVVDIANKLSISKPSVCSTLTWLKSNGYVEYNRYSTASLTPKGLDLAKNVRKKHKILLEFFKEVLKVDSEKASNVACQMEHIIDEDIMLKIKAFNKNYKN